MSIEAKRNQIRRAIYFALPDVVRDERDYRLEQYSHICDRQVDGLKSLSDEELCLVYYCLKSHESVENVEFAHFSAFNNDLKQHGHILSLARQIGWVNGKYVDAERLGKFIASNKSPVQMPLLLMSSQEASKIIIALKGILQSQLKTA